jgi:hypothetical protein
VGYGNPETAENAIAACCEMRHGSQTGLKGLHETCALKEESKRYIADLSALQTAGTDKSDGQLSLVRESTNTAVNKGCQ